MEFLRRIFPLLRATRIYAIFNTGLKKWLLRVRDILFVFFYPEYLALVLSATNPVQQLTFLLSIFADGMDSPLPFWGPSQSFGFCLLPSRVRRLEWGHQVKSSGFHCDPHSFLTVILWRLATVNSNTRIVVILFLSSQWDTTWQRLFQTTNWNLTENDKDIATEGKPSKRNKITTNSSKKQRHKDHLKRSSIVRKRIARVGYVLTKMKRLISECCKLIQRTYKTRHDWERKVIHRELCKKLKFDRATKSNGICTNQSPAWTVRRLKFPGILRYQQSTKSRPEYQA